KRAFNSARRKLLPVAPGSIRHSYELTRSPSYRVGAQRYSVTKKSPNFFRFHARAKKPPVQTLAAAMDGTHKRRISAEVNQQSSVIVNVAAIEFANEVSPRGSVFERVFGFSTALGPTCDRRHGRGHNELQPRQFAASILTRLGVEVRLGFAATQQRSVRKKPVNDLLCAYFVVVHSWF